MTIIAGLYDGDDAILIAADSGQTEMPGGIRSLDLEKLQAHESAPLAWGACGNPTIGVERFATWLRVYHWPPADYATFRYDVALYLAECNGQQRRLCETARVAPQDNDLAAVLVVGYLGIPFMFDVDDRGVDTPYSARDGFHAIGSGGGPAKIAYTVLKPFSSQDFSRERRLHHVMECAATMAQSCDPPIHIWRITPEGIVKLPGKQRKDT